MENDGFIVIEGIHKNPNNIDTIDEKTKKIHGPFKKKQAEIFAKSLISKSIFWHISAVPALPGATNSFAYFELCLIFQAKTFSLPPEPIINIFIKLFL